MLKIFFLLLDICFQSKAVSGRKKSWGEGRHWGWDSSKGDNNTYNSGRKEMAQVDQLKEDIHLRMVEEDEAKRQDALNKAKVKRLEIKEEKMKIWKEKWRTWSRS
jgi:hypothetical protein